MQSGQADREAVLDRDFQALPREAAELIGLKALGWIAAQPELAGRFLDAAGASAGEMRERAADPEFLGFVLDFLLGDEEALLAFATNEGLAPDRPLRARAALPGGALPNWT
ncbi:MAG TPA: DUF3572 domain-containing protein [Paracoccaceae bacterium]|nr:DUF3572 domain-containing protein [Paracoccaceae bacterium]